LWKWQCALTFGFSRRHVMSSAEPVLGSTQVQKSVYLLPQSNIGFRKIHILWINLVLKSVHDVISSDTSPFFLLIFCSHREGWGFYFSRGKNLYTPLFKTIVLQTSILWKTL
jgi:hypothetical protein